MAGGDDAIEGDHRERSGAEGGDEVGASLLHVGGSERGVDASVQGVLRGFVFKGALLNEAKKILVQQPRMCRRRGRGDSGMCRR